MDANMGLKLIYWSWSPSASYHAEPHPPLMILTPGAYAAKIQSIWTEKRPLSPLSRGFYREARQPSYAYE